MTAKEFLQRYRRLDALKRCKASVIQSDIELLQSTKAALQTVDSSIIFDGITALEQLITELTQATADLIRQKQKILTALEAITDTTAAEIVQLRYIHGKEWDEIAEFIGYSKRQIYTLHAAALDEVQKYLEKW